MRQQTCVTASREHFPEGAVKLSAARIACVACLVSLAAASRVSAADDVPSVATVSIRQQLQEAGAFERIVVDAAQPPQLADLVARADLVVEASAVGSRAYLNGDTDIYTDYIFTVHALIKNLRRPDLRSGQTITVRRDSGVIDVDGRTAASYENGFPAFNANEHYILFLKDRDRDYVYAVFGGAHGAFNADSERITPVATAVADTVEAAQPIPRPIFFGEIRALLKFAEH
jgi:hypothetical protein